MECRYPRGIDLCRILCRLPRAEWHRCICGSALVCPCRPHGQERCGAAPNYHGRAWSHADMARQTLERGADRRAWVHTHSPAAVPEWNCPGIADSAIALFLIWADERRETLPGLPPVSIRVTGGYGLRSFPGTTTLVVMAGQGQAWSD